MQRVGRTSISARVNLLFELKLWGGGGGGRGRGERLTDTDVFRKSPSAQSSVLSEKSMYDISVVRPLDRAGPMGALLPDTSQHFAWKTPATSAAPPEIPASVKQRGEITKHGEPCGHGCVVPQTARQHFLLLPTSNLPSAPAPLLRLCMKIRLIVFQVAFLCSDARFSCLVPQRTISSSGPYAAINQNM